MKIIPKEATASAELHVEIPMHGMADSKCSNSVQCNELLLELEFYVVNKTSDVIQTVKCSSLFILNILERCLSNLTTGPN